MARKFFAWVVLVVCCACSLTSALGQNAQCTLVTGPNFGQVVPVTVNPAPPLNAACQVGGSKGYISRTSSGVGVNANSECTIAWAGNTLEAPFYGNPVPALDAPCHLGTFAGYISKTSGPSGNPNSQCTVLQMSFEQGYPSVGMAVPYYANPAPAQNAGCTVGNQVGFVSATSRGGFVANEACTLDGITRLDGSTVIAAYESHPALPLNSKCTVAAGTGVSGLGFTGHISLTSPAWYRGSKPFDLVWVTDSDGTIWDSGYDRNGYPLNPLWFSQITNPSYRPNFGDEKNPEGQPPLCSPALSVKGGYSPIVTGFVQCTSDPVQLDIVGGNFYNYLGYCPANPIPGHMNWFIATYTGSLNFDDWSDGSFNPLDWSSGQNWENLDQDHDYNFALIHQCCSGLTSSDADRPAALQVEFKSDESIDKYFQSPWWQNFRTEVENTNYTAYLPVIWTPAVVTGLLGVDGVHGGGYTELHPAFSMALHNAGDDPDTFAFNAAGQFYTDEHWHFFIRNSGTEGSCSHETWSWKSLNGHDYYIQLPWPIVNNQPAVSMKLIQGYAYAWNNSFQPWSVEQNPGKWTYLHFTLPAVGEGIGYDGNITLEYTFPQGTCSKYAKNCSFTTGNTTIGVNYLASEERLRKPSSPQAHIGHDDEVNWSKALQSLPDPAVKQRLARVLAPTAVVKFPTGKPLAVESRVTTFHGMPPAATGGALRPDTSPDPVKERHLDDIADVLGYASLRFQALPGSQDIFVMGFDRNLWLEHPPFGKLPPARQQVDENVQSFQEIDSQTALVLGTDGHLWLEHAPFGKVPPARQQVDGNVLSFQALDPQNIFVLGGDRKLWLEHAPFQKVPPARQQVDGNVRNFQALDAAQVLVVGTDDKLWLEQAPFGKVPPARQQVDGNVWSSYAPHGTTSAFVLGADGNLWLEQPPFGKVPPTRQQVDANVQSFKATTLLDWVWTLDNDRNLWLEQGPFGKLPPARKQIDGNVRAFQPLDLNHVLVLGTDGDLWLEQSPFGKVPPNRVQVDGNVR